MPELIIQTDKSYELSELFKTTTNQDTDLIYIARLVDGEYVAYAVTRSQFLSGLAGTLGIEKDGTAVGNATTLNLIEGANVTITAVDAGSGQINVTIAASGGSGSVAWGGITGTLANQTDLQNALNALASDISDNATNIGINVSDISDNTDAISLLESDVADIEIDVANIQADYVSADADFDTAGRVVIVDSAGRKVVQGSKLLANLRTESDVSGTARIYTKGQHSTQVVATPAAGNLDFDLADSNSFRATIGSATELQFPTYNAAALPTDFSTSFAFKITFSADADLTFATGYFDGDTALPTISGLNTEVYMLYGYVDEDGSFIDVNVVQKT